MCLTQEYETHKGKGPKAKWAKINHDYNVRVEVPYRTTQQTLRRDYEVCRAIQQPTHSLEKRVPLVSQTRRITWADIGGRKKHMIHGHEAPISCITSSIRETIYYAAYRILRKKDLIANMASMHARAITCALTSNRAVVDTGKPTKAEKIKMTSPESHPYDPREPFDTHPQQTGISCVPYPQPEDPHIFSHDDHLHGYPGYDFAEQGENIEEDVFNLGCDFDIA